MVGRAKSITKRRREENDERELLIHEVLTRYEARSTRTVEGACPKGMRTICEEVSNEHAEATGRRILLDHSTLSQHPFQPAELEFRGVNRAGESQFHTVSARQLRGVKSHIYAEWTVGVKVLFTCRHECDLGATEFLMGFPYAERLYPGYAYLKF
ncbi:hypothetical protein BDV93DRAFT_513385 [Ceratobasidium sp. AG-I]|nr:hypothetical protein BDV93DRAFT_513385 [Ceratobasidium sp. AG-I]